ncbi:MAG: SOS response-associated peptidase [Comamonadaceae bacterium]|nr:SOS response-associated peptidase [Comamonadaceae bacterium]
MPLRRAGTSLRRARSWRCSAATAGGSWWVWSWGFVPRWARDLEGPKPINARSDTIFAKPMFQDAIRHRRCLIPVDGFYEWRRDGSRKQPYYFRMADGHPFALAGIWDTWAGRTAGEEGYTLRSCAILTTAANQLMAPVHDRMPVIVPAESHERWLARDLIPRRPDRRAVAAAGFGTHGGLRGQHQRQQGRERRPGADRIALARRRLCVRCAFDRTRFIV